MKTKSDLPGYLTSFDQLQQHFRAQLEGLSTTEKGNKFARFVQRLLPQTEIGSDFKLPELSGKVSGDEGVDLTAEGKDGKASLYIQSKLWVDRADLVDSVISKFQAFTTKKGPKQPKLFDPKSRSIHFLLATLSPISGIFKKYEEIEYGSKDFYRKCKEEHRIHFIDGHQILPILRATYNKLSQIPTELVLNFDTPYIFKSNVYIGVISNSELKGLYTKFGDALFFENVRDFLGVQRGSEKLGRTTPNNEIIKTITQYPEKMLSRNNGIVFGADKVQQGSSPNQLILNNGSVVNGCQTTMCLVEYSELPSSVLVKVVETSDSWDITKSANYQTAIPDIDLELARYLRPQLVKRAASNLGVQINGVEKSAFQLIDEIYNHKVAYQETRLLYIGLFSRSPNNVFASNYTELMQELISELFEQSSYEQEIFDTLFLLQGASQESLKEAQEIFKNQSYAGMFDRLYKDDSLPYRCFLSILALCGAISINIADRQSDLKKEYERTIDFLSNAKLLLKNQNSRFPKFHKLAVKIWMQDNLGDEDDAEIRRDMYIRTKRLNFTNMYRKICMEADLEMSISKN
jgi:hypothetical protein